MTRTADLDLAVLGNCNIAALVDKFARIVWCCIPRFDGDPIFCQLLRDPALPPDGHWDIELSDVKTTHQNYLKNSAVLETIQHDEHGNAIRIVDFIPRFIRWRRMFRPVSIVRLVEPLHGVPRICVRLKPRFDYGCGQPIQTRGSNHIRYILGSQVLRLTTNASVSLIQAETPFVVEKPLVMILGADESVDADLKFIGTDWFDQTLNYWREWCRQLSVPFEWQEAVIRAAITLKLCSYEETGGIVAALTTSIPESSDTNGRNWDYRFCWLRDAFFVVQTLNRLSVTRTMEHYISYINNIVSREDIDALPPIFRIGFETDLCESKVPADALAGYRGVGPVRKGNDAFLQVQNDAYGSVVLAVAQSFFDARVVHPGDISLFRKLEHLGELAAQRWNQPDAGLWEFRTRNEVHTQSAVMCWAACNSLANIAARLGMVHRAKLWQERADHMRGEIIEKTWNPKLNSFVATFGGNEVDGSLLHLHQLGFLKPDDPRFATTIARVEQELREGYHVFRYRRPDDFGVPEASFTICSFWLVEALHAVGRREEAREIFEQLLSHRSSLGLLSEGMDPRTGELWGNFPQTYSLVGLVSAAMRLSRPWENAF